MTVQCAVAQLRKQEIISSTLEAMIRSERAYFLDRLEHLKIVSADFSDAFAKAKNSGWSPRARIRRALHLAFCALNTVAIDCIWARDRIRKFPRNHEVKRIIEECSKKS
jgi:hypothetical protein